MPKIILQNFNSELTTETEQPKPFLMLSALGADSLVFVFFKVEDSDGDDRVLITFNGKFLPFIEQTQEGADDFSYGSNQDSDEGSDEDYDEERRFSFSLPTGSPIRSETRMKPGEGQPTFDILYSSVEAYYCRSHCR